jgi:L-malate glycosyltransferase
MKILHVVLTPRLSGAEVLVRDLSRQQVRLGHEVGVCALHPAEASFSGALELLAEEGVSLFCPDRPLGRLGRLKQVRRANRAFGPDAVFAHSVIPAAYARVADWPRRRTIPVLHATDNYPKHSSARYLEYGLSRMTPLVISVSEAGKRNYSEVFPCLVKFIKNGLDLSKIRFAAELRSTVTNVPPVLIQVGRIARVKGQHFAIQALAHVVKSVPDIRLQLVGILEDKAYLQELQELILSLGLAGNVEFLGARSDVFSLLGSAGVYLMPSSAEANSVAMLEALASGIPIIGSDIAGLRKFHSSPGVVLLPRNEHARWAEQIIAFLRGPGYFHRDLSECDIVQTAEAYASAAATTIYRVNDRSNASGRGAREQKI